MQIIKVTYTNEDIIDYDSFDNISDFNLVSKINCASNKLTSLPDNMNFPNLHMFDYADNELTSLPDNMNFPNLQYFCCSNNKLTLLPENMNFPNLREFLCLGNNLTKEQELMKLSPQIEEFINRNIYIIF